MSTDVKNVTIAGLIEAGLLHRATCEAQSLRYPKLNGILAGDRGTEPDSTRFLTWTDGALEKAITDYFCDIAGIPPEARDGLRLISGSEFRFDSGARDRRSIDLVAARRTKESTGARRERVWKAVIAIEAKYTAAVNDGLVYCKQDPMNPQYSNQVICYSHGCIDERLDKDVVFIWLANPVGPEMHAKYGPWADKGINENDLKWEVMNAAYPAQQAAMKVWKSATWAGLGRAISGTLTPKGLAAEADAIVRFLRAGGPSSN